PGLGCADSVGGKAPLRNHQVAPRIRIGHDRSRLEGIRHLIGAICEDAQVRCPALTLVDSPVDREWTPGLEEHNHTNVPGTQDAFEWSRAGDPAVSSAKRQTVRIAEY